MTSLGKTSLITKTIEGESDRVQHAVRFDDSKRFGECYTGMEPAPFARVPHPVDIKPVWSHAVDTGERRIELLAAIVLPSRPVALHEAISLSGPRAPNVNDIVPFGRSDLRQEARFQDVANEHFAGCDNRSLLHSVDRGRTFGPGRPDPPLFVCHILDPYSSFADFILHAARG